MQKLIQEVKKEIVKEKDATTKYYIKQTFKEIEAKEKAVAKLQSEIKDLKEQLKTGKFKGMSSCWVTINGTCWTHTNSSRTWNYPDDIDCTLHGMWWANRPFQSRVLVPGAGP